MFTAEEIENFDIFPKQYTLSCILKFCLYSVSMLIGLILMYSFYSGRDFVSIVSLESLAFSGSSFFLKRLAALQPKEMYIQHKKYNIDYSENITDTFVINYINENFPALIKEAAKGFNVIELYNEFENRLNSDNTLSPLYIEKRTEPSMDYFKKGFEYTKANYSEYQSLIKSNNTKNIYVINDLSLNVLQSTLTTSLVSKHIVSPLLTKYLKFSGAFYSEGHSHIVIGGHSELSENFLCMVKGEVDLLMVPAMQREYVYPYRNQYGPSHYSPVPFFKGEFGRFPLFKKADRIHVTVSEGDCMYIPAFWWRSIQTKKEKEFKYITLKYESNSRYLQQLFMGIEFGKFN